MRQDYYEKQVIDYCRLKNIKIINDKIAEEHKLEIQILIEGLKKKEKSNQINFKKEPKNISAIIDKIFKKTMENMPK